MFYFQKNLYSLFAYFNIIKGLSISHSNHADYAPINLMYYTTELCKLQVIITSRWCQSCTYDLIALVFGEMISSLSYRGH